MNALAMQLFSRALGLASVVGFALLLVAGCTKPTEQDLLQSARASIKAADYRSAELHAKNALQVNQNSAEARFILGKALLDPASRSSASMRRFENRSLRVTRGVRSALAALFPDRRAITG